MTNNINTEQVLNKIGCHGRLQAFISVLFILIAIMVDYISVSLPIMTTPPIVTFTDEHGVFRHVALEYEYCKYPDLKVDYEKSRSSWSIDFGIYCDKFKVSLISSFFYLGAVMTNIYVFFFTKYSKETTLKICGILYVITNVFIIWADYYKTLIFIACMGFAQLMIYLLRVSILTETTCSEYRSYFINSQFISGILGSLTLSLFLYFDLNWKYNFFILAGFMSIFTMLNFLFVPTNPIYLIINEYYEEAKKSCYYYYEFNKKSIVCLLNATNYDKTENNEDEIKDISEFIKKFENCKLTLDNIDQKTQNQIEIMDESVHDTVSIRSELKSKKISKIENLKKIETESYINDNKELLLNTMNMSKSSQNQDLSIDIDSKNVKDNRPSDENNIDSRNYIRENENNDIKTYENDKKDNNNNEKLLNNSIVNTTGNTSYMLNINQEESTLWFKLKLGIITGTHNIIFQLTYYESKKFANTDGVELVIIIYSIMSVVIILLLGKIMNIELFGRKRTSLIFYTIGVIPRIIDMFSIGFVSIHVYYYLIRVAITLCHVSTNTLVFESFSNKGRIKYYGFIFFIVKIITFFVPYLFEFMSHQTYYIFQITMNIILICFITIFAKETLGKVLNDY